MNFEDACKATGQLYFESRLEIERLQLEIRELRAKLVQCEVEKEQALKLIGESRE